MWLLLGGVVLGAAGVVVIQERYLPQRLSAKASAELRQAFDRSDLERQRLQRELGETASRLEAALVDKKGQAEALAASQASAARARDDLSAVVAALPPDPRGGEVEVRAGRFTSKAGGLVYDVVLTRERAKDKTAAGQVQFVVTGASSRGGYSAITSPPIPTAATSLQVVRGTLPLPEGFRPRQAMIQVLDRAGGRILGMRVMLVN